MKTKRVISGASIGGLLTAPLMALMYLADVLLDLPFVPFDVFDWMAKLLPGPVITFGIDLMIDAMRFLGLNVASTAKTAEQVLAVIQYLGLGILAGGVFYLILDHQKIKTTFLSSVVTGALFGFPAIAISVGFGSSKVNPIVSIIWLSTVYIGWGVSLILIYDKILVYEVSQISPVDEIESKSVQKLNRRQFLVLLGAGSATITVLGTGIAQLLSRGLSGIFDDTMAHQTEGPKGDTFPNMSDLISPVPGTRPEYTPIKDHYQVFLELEPTVIDGATWKLPVTGMVENSLMLTIDDIRTKYPTRNQYVTLSCISGRVGTSLISTTYWTGASVQDILADAGVQDGARYIIITSGDGFHETVPLDLIYSDPRIMFCYEWDGNVLPVEHGFPLRIWIPDRYGMKQPKWITGIEVTDTYQEGYWVERNWSEIAQVKTTSVIDTVAVDHVFRKDGQNYIPVGGIAFSGDRQISKVEVRVDNGSWVRSATSFPAFRNHLGNLALRMAFHQR